MSLIISRVDSRECSTKPSGFSQTFYQKPSGFSQMFYQAEWILANLLSKAEWILANVYQAEWILANVLPSQVDSRKPFIKSRVGSRECFTKPSGFLQMFYQTEWISGKLS